MTLYEALKLIHILAAIAWIGAAFLTQIQGARATKSGDPGRLLAYSEEMAWMGPHYFAPASIIVVLSGIGMVIESAWNFSDTWIVIGIVLYVITTATGIAYFAPQSERIAEGVRKGGPPDAELQRRIANVTLVSRIDLVILVAVVADMVVKPGI